MIKKIFLLLIFFTFKSNIFAENHNNIIESAKNIMILYNNKTNKDEINTKLIDLKELVQFNIKTGNPLSSIELYLFLDGIINDNLYSLQSFLSQIETNQIPPYISKMINDDISKKIELAINENKIAIKTNILVNIPKTKNQCNLYINGILSNNKFSFYTPSGIPIYVGLYCDDNTFEIQKISSEEAQQILNLKFNNFKEQNKIPDFVPNPNPNPSTKINKINNIKISDKENTEQFKFEKKLFQFGTGIGFSKDFGSLYRENIYNLKLWKGYFIYSSSYLKYNFLLFSFDFSKINLKEKKQIIFEKSDISTKSTIEDNVFQTKYFMRPGLGISLPISQLSQIALLENDFLLNTSIFTNGSFSMSQTGYGIQNLFGLSIKLNSKFLFNFKVGGSYTFGEINGVQLTSQAQIGYYF